MIPENTDNHAVMETFPEICISWQSPELNGISECYKKKRRCQVTLIVFKTKITKRNKEHEVTGPI